MVRKSNGRPLDAATLAGRCPACGCALLTDLGIGEACELVGFVGVNEVLAQLGSGESLEHARWWVCKGCDNCGASTRWQML